MGLKPYFVEGEWLYDAGTYADFVWAKDYDDAAIELITLMNQVEPLDERVEYDILCVQELEAWIAGGQEVLEDARAFINKGLGVSWAGHEQARV